MTGALPQIKSRPFQWFQPAIGGCEITQSSGSACVVANPDITPILALYPASRLPSRNVGKAAEPLPLDERFLVALSFSYRVSIHAFSKLVTQLTPAFLFESSVFVV